MARGRRVADATARRPAAGARSATRARPGSAAPHRRPGPERRPADDRRFADARREVPGDTGLGGVLRESSRPLATRTDTADTVLGPRGYTMRRVGILAAVLVFLVVSISVPVRNHYEFVDQERTLAAERAQLEDDIARLQQERDKLNDSQYIEAQARQRFGAIKPGEMPYRVVDDQTAQRQAEQAAAEEAANYRPWNDVLWGSVAGGPRQ